MFSSIKDLGIHHKNECIQSEENPANKRMNLHLKHFYLGIRVLQKPYKEANSVSIAITKKKKEKKEG